MDQPAPAQADEAAGRPATRETRPPGAADAFVRRILRVPANGDPGRNAEKVFGRSVLLSALRCTLTYVILPLLKPVIDLSGGVGPVLGLIVGTVSAVAIVASMRRFWRAGHRFRWYYTVIGGAILVMLVVSAITDIISLL
ncbi:MAG: hypothetical protein M3Y04_00495 [Actinomycetota bacterium]|nr:hypothetical protein [Actinomycetota bacterium]